MGGYRYSTTTVDLYRWAGLEGGEGEIVDGGIHIMQTNAS